jgi:hypothetical protein
MIAFNRYNVLTSFWSLMIVRSTITVDEVLAALNAVPPTPSDYARFLSKFSDSPDREMSALQEWVDEANQRMKTPEVRFQLNYLANPPIITPSSPAINKYWRLPETISRHEAAPFRVALTSARLRTYVDAWLETGRHSDRSELPAQRNLREAFVAHTAVWEYMAKAPVQWIPSRDLADFDFVGYVAERGGYSGEVRGFFEAQDVEATRLFVGTMASDWKDRLCKCRYLNCGCYFLYARPRKRYSYGTFCSGEHMRRAAAVRFVRLARSRGTQALIDAAARTLRDRKIRSSDWQDDAYLKRQLASKLCLAISREKLHGYRQEVKVNWITRHQEMIERRRCEL